MSSKSSSRSLLCLGSELSAVINRVRQAYGWFSMQEFADSTEIKEAERLVDRTARQILGGQADPEAWPQALRQYEEAWLKQLPRKGSAPLRCLNRALEVKGG